MSAMNCQELIRQFCLKRNVEAPAPTEKGWFTLDFCDSGEVSCIPKPGEIILSTEITKLRNHELEDAHTLKKLLNYSFITLAEQRGMLSLDRKNNVVFLWTPLALRDATLSTFESLLEKFLNYSDKLRRQTEKL